MQWFGMHARTHTRSERYLDVHVNNMSLLELSKCLNEYCHQKKKRQKIKKQQKASDET